VLARYTRTAILPRPGMLTAGVAGPGLIVVAARTRRRAAAPGRPAGESRSPAA